MQRYQTVLKQADTEMTVQKSKFIAHVSPVSSREEADEFIRIMRKQNYDATHNVPALVIGDNFEIQWGSDDGEPQGTSGAPIVQMLVQERFTNLVIVVTRYFGGIKLGTGGLVRAYTQVAKLGLAAAEPASMEEKLLLSFETDYSTFSRISNFGFENKAIVDNVQYTDKVGFDLYLEEEDRPAITEMMAGLTKGKLQPLSEGHRIFGVPLDYKA